MAGSRKGLRCHVCTGCGLCPGVVRDERQTKKLHILTQIDFQGDREQMAVPSVRKAIAVDIGTTTVAMLLTDDKGAVLSRYVELNPQAEYGPDVISRIQAAEDPVAAKRQQLLMQTVLEKGIRKFESEGFLVKGEKPSIYLAGNTTMSYLLQGIQPGELGAAPFTATHKESAEVLLGDYVGNTMPCLSAFVGGDITAGIYAADILEKEEITLLIDLGTNGEIVLGNRERCIACATAAGPAFEGGANRGIFGADMVSLIAALLREGALDETGLLRDTYFDTGVKVGNVVVTQETIRILQTAKAAIAAGIEILLQAYGITEAAVDRIILAGGFGYFLHPEDAVTIGLLPENLAEKAVSGGNTALAGCVKAALAEVTCVKGKLSKIFDKVECLNLAEVPSFNNIYIERMALKKFSV